LAIIIANGIFPQKYPNSYFKNISTRPFFNDEPSYDSKLWKNLVDIILSKILNKSSYSTWKSLRQGWESWLPLEPVRNEMKDGSERGLMDSLVPMRMEHSRGCRPMWIGSRPNQKKKLINLSIQRIHW